MARMPLDQAAELTAADVVHSRFSALPAAATVADVRAWFDASSHRLMAFLAADGRYAGSLTRDDLAADLDPGEPAVGRAHDGPTIAPEASARAAFELALESAALRVPVVDRDGVLVGVVGVTDDRAAFCGVGKHRSTASAQAEASYRIVIVPEGTFTRLSRHGWLRIVPHAGRGPCAVPPFR